METTDVVLVRPWDYGFEYVEWQENIQIAYLAAFLESQGHRCKIIDLAVKQVRAEHELFVEWESILALKPLIVAFILDKHPTNNPFYATELVRSFNCRVQSSTWTPHLTIYGHTQLGTDRLLRELPLSSIVTGEEADFTSLVAALKGCEGLLSAPGIAFINPVGVIQHNPPMPLCLELDSLPLPRRYLIEGVAGLKPDRKYVAAMQASRGCYAKCAFCFLRAKEKLHGLYPWRSRSPESIVEEMEHLYRQFGVREFAFVDSQFFGPSAKGQERAQKLSAAILARGLEGIAFSIYARAESIWPETIALLKQAGLYAVFVGIESFNQSVLDRYNKGQTVADNLRAIQVLKDFDVRLRIGFITFDYLTTFEELHKNISALKSICLDKAHLITQPLFFQNVLVPLEDTPLGEEYETIGASTASPTDTSSLLIIQQQRRFSCNGAVTNLNRNPRILALAEAARILGSEVLLRTSHLELETSRILEQSTNTALINQVPVSLATLISWFSDLTPFVVDLFDQVVRAIEDNTEAPLEQIEKVYNLILLACDQYDVDHFGVPVTEVMQIRTLRSLVG